MVMQSIDVLCLCDLGESLWKIAMKKNTLRNLKEYLKQRLKEELINEVSLEEWENF